MYLFPILFLITLNGFLILFIFFKDIFLMWTIVKVSIEFVIILLLFKNLF